MDAGDVQEVADDSRLLHDVAFHSPYIGIGQILMNMFTLNMSVRITGRTYQVLASATIPC